MGLKASSLCRHSSAVLSHYSATCTELHTEHSFIKTNTEMISLSPLIVVVLTFVTTTNAEECSTTELFDNRQQYLEGCTSDVGFGGFSAISALTDEQIKAVCDSSDCMELMDSMRAMDFGNCIIQGTNISLGSDILDPFERVCSGSGSVDLSSSSVGDGSVGSTASGSSAVGRAASVALGWASLLAVLVF